MRFKERNDLANRCKKWMKDQLESNNTTPLDTVHMVLIYLDVNGYLNEVVHGEWIEEDDYCECSRCGYRSHSHDNYCSVCGAEMEGGKDERFNQ